MFQQVQIEIVQVHVSTSTNRIADNVAQNYMSFNHGFLWNKMYILETASYIDLIQFLINMPYVKIPVYPGV